MGIAYIHNNIFLYSDEARTLAHVVRDILDTARDNLLWVFLTLAAMLALLFDRQEKLQLKLALLSMAACAFASVYLIGRTWPYSPMALGAFALCVFPAVSCRADRIARAWVRRLNLAVSCALALVVALFLSPNAYLRGVPREEMAQYRLAQYVHEGATLLQYSHLDDGLYLASGRLPQEKYFVRLNVNYDEMFDALERSIREGMPDYVLTAWSPLPEEYDHYQLIATDAGYDDRDRINKLLYLYRRR